LRDKTGIIIIKDHFWYLTGLLFRHAGPGIWAEGYYKNEQSSCPPPIEPVLADVEAWVLSDRVFSVADAFWNCDVP
jgi:hypothetical protein